MPFPFSASVHRGWEIFTALLRPIPAAQAGRGGPRLCPSCSITHHLPSSPFCSAAGRACHLRSMGTSLLPPFWGCQGLGWKMLVLPFWAAHERKQMSPTSESRDGQRTAPGAAEHADGFPVPQEKATSGREAKTKLAGAKGGTRCGSRSPGRSENKQSRPYAWAESRCWNLKGNKKTQLVPYFFFFAGLGAPGGGENLAYTQPKQCCVLSRAE